MWFFNEENDNNKVYNNQWQKTQIFFAQKKECKIILMKITLYLMKNLNY